MPAEESADFRAELEKDLIYLSTFGLEDPLNEGIQDSVDYIAHGHPDLKHNADNNKKNVNIRMVSGDHINTAMAVAYQAGILD